MTPNRSSLVIITRDTELFHIFDWKDTSENKPCVVDDLDCTTSGNDMGVQIVVVFVVVSFYFMRVTGMDAFSPAKGQFLEMMKKLHGWLMMKINLLRNIIKSTGGLCTLGNI